MCVRKLLTKHHTFAGLAFWKSPSRKIYAVKRKHGNALGKRKLQTALSDDDDFEPDDFEPGKICLAKWRNIYKGVPAGCIFDCVNIAFPLPHPPTHSTMLATKTYLVKYFLACGVL